MGLRDFWPFLERKEEEIKVLTRASGAPAPNPIERDLGVLDAIGQVLESAKRVQEQQQRERGEEGDVEMAPGREFKLSQSSPSTDCSRAVR